MSTFVDQAMSDGVVWAKTIPYSNRPKVHQLDIDFTMPRIFNYSEYFESLSPAAQGDLVPPGEILTGDMVMANAFVRGVGARYAVWLFAGVFTNDSVPKPKVDSDEEEQEEEEEKNVRAPPADSCGSKRKRDQEDIDPYSFGLTEAELMQLQALLCDDVDDPDMWTARMRSLLHDRNPALLEALLSDEDGTYTEAFSSLRFSSQDPPKTGRDSAGGEREKDEANEEERDEDEEEEGDEDAESLLDEYDTTPQASSRFDDLPRAAYPKLVHRKELNKLSTLPFMQLYLFEHLDEYGYAAHPAVSMAPKNYFPWEYEDRHIDVGLLPDVLQAGTDFGFALKRLLDRLPRNRVAVDPIAVIEFDGEDAIMWMSEDKAEEYFCPDREYGLPSIRTTRGMFREHAQKIRELVAGGSAADEPAKVAAVTEHELSEFLRGLLPTVFA